MDGETNAKIADGIAAELADIDENEPGYSATGRAFLIGAERAFRRHGSSVCSGAQLVRAS